MQVNLERARLVRVLARHLEHTRARLVRALARHPKLRTQSISEEQIARLIMLVNAYVTAYRDRMEPPPQGQAPQLWAGRPIHLEYRAALSFVQTLQVCQQRYDPKTSESFVDDLLTAALKRPETIEAEVRKIAAILNHNILTKLYIPLDGIEIDAAEYRFGAISLVRMDEPAFDQRITDKAADVIRDNPHYTDAQKATFVAHLREELESLRNRVCAEIPTDLDIPKTFAFATQTAISSLCDFLQFAASVFLPHDKTLNISWAEDARVVLRWAFATSDGPAKASNRHAERVSVGHPFEIEGTRLAKMAELRLDRVANLVGREAPSEYDAMLQRAIRWFAKGERELHPDDRKLSYITVVDLFFSQPGPGATDRICKGFAFALATTPEAVPRVARYMFNMFASRSATSHAGELDILQQPDLDSLRWHVQQFILAMVRHGFRDKKDIRRWLAAQEAALVPELRVALREATEWRRVEAERCMLFVAGALLELQQAKLYDPPRARTVRALVTALRNGARAGGKWVADVCPIAEQMATANDTIAAKIAKAAATKRDAIIYLNTAIRILETVTWIKQAIDEADNSGKG